MVNYNNPNDIPVVDYDLSKVPEPIRKRAEGIENARYGKQNKAFLKQGIEIAGVIAQEALETASYDGNSLADVTLAKGNYNALYERLDANDNEVETITSQVAKKADQSFVDSQFSSIVSGAPKGTYTDLSALQSAYPSGAEGVFLVLENGHWYYWQNTTSQWTDGGVYQAEEVADGSLTTEKYAQKSITPDKIKGIEYYGETPTANLFNKQTVIEGGYYGSNGIWVDDAEYVTSDFIPIEYLANYAFIVDKLTVPTPTSYYTKDKNWRHYNPSVATIQNATEANAFIRIGVKKTDVDKFMFVRSGTDVSEYIPHMDIIYMLPDNVYANKIPDGSVTRDKIANDVVTPDKIKGIEYYREAPTANLFNKETVTVDGYYGSNGIWVDDTNYVASDFIPIEYPANYAFIVNNYTVQTPVSYYTKDKNWRHYNSSVSTIQNSTEANAFIRIGVKKTDVDKFMFVPSGTDVSEYIPHTKPQYLITDMYVMEDKKDTDVPDDTDVPEETSLLDDYIIPASTDIEVLDLVDFSGTNEPFHPSVIFIPEGFGGYKYWMAQSPYPVNSVTKTGQSRDRWEAPVVYKSLDGISEWLPVANPLDDLTPQQITNQDYFSDPHILYREDLNRIEVWYRFTDKLNGNQTTIYRKTTSDGQTWTEREVMVEPKTSSSGNEFHRSGSYHWNVDRYEVWYTNNVGIHYQYLKDGLWSVPEKCEIDVPNQHWHIDVNYFRSEYHMLCYDESAGTVSYYKSNDGRLFSKQRTIFDVTTDDNPLYSVRLYRAISMLDADNKIRIYATFENSKRTNIGLIIADKFDSFRVSDSLNPKKILLSEGQTLSDEIEKMRFGFKL